MGETAVSVKDAVRIAVQYVRDLLSDESLSDLRLEEVERSESGDHWLITVGFSRPEPQQSISPITNSIAERLRGRVLNREYRIVKVLAGSGEVQWMKIRKP